MSETAQEREEQLVKLRRRMGRLLRRGETAEFDRLSAVYASLRAQQAAAEQEEQVAQRRAARAALRAQQVRERVEPWKLPAGFGRSPGAVERDRRPRREEPVAPAGGLRPWRGRGLMQQRIWRP